MKNISSLIIAAVFLCSVGCAGLQHSSESDQKPSFAIKHLSVISAPAFEVGSDKDEPKEVYVIVHPSYYVFFHDKDTLIPHEKGKNIVRTFVEKEDNNPDAAMQLLKEYEKAEMQFLSAAKTDNKTVVLIIPGNYASSSQYIYKDNPEAYSQYINELTRDAKNIFYLESKSAHTGKMSDSDQTILLNFLKKTGVERVSLGGGYIGRCQKEVYNFLAQAWSVDNVAIIPELSAFSPDDLSDTTARMLLTPERKLNKYAVNIFITNGGIKGLTSNRPNLKNISRLTVN